MDFYQTNVMLENIIVKTVHREKQKLSFKTQIGQFWHFLLMETCNACGRLGRVFNMRL